MQNNKPLAKRMTINGVECRLVKGFGPAKFNLPQGDGSSSANTSKAIKTDDGRIIDFQDIQMEGYVTTWSEDDTGETSKADAFTKEMIDEYMRVPALMVDHGWGCSSLAGSVTEAEPDMHGVKIKAMVSNAPDLCSLRFKIAEGHCKTFSISGYASMDEVTGVYTLLKWIESSIVAMPANRECQFSVTDGAPVVGKSKKIPCPANDPTIQAGAAGKAPEKSDLPAAPKPAPKSETGTYEPVQGLKLKI